MGLVNRADYYRRKFIDRDWLYQEYVVNKKPIKRIASQCRCHLVTIHRYIKKYNFPSRYNEMQANGMWGLKKEKNPMWKGGRRKHNGYINIRVDGHPYAGATGYVPEHRLVMEKHIGRYLLPTELVHHKNGVRDDNHIENLELFSSSNHLKKHHESFVENERLKVENKKLLLLLGVIMMTKSMDKGDLRLAS